MINSTINNTAFSGFKLGLNLNPNKWRLYHYGWFIDLLIGFLSHNANTGVTAKPLIAGETTLWEKLQGLDNSLNENEIK